MSCFSFPLSCLVAEKIEEMKKSKKEKEKKVKLILYQLFLYIFSGNSAHAEKESS